MVPPLRESYGERLLELIPTSSELKKYVRDLSLIVISNVFFRRCLYEQIIPTVRMGACIRKNPNQSLASFFLVALILLYASAGLTNNAQTTMRPIKTTTTTTTTATATATTAQEEEKVLIRENHAPVVPLPDRFRFLANHNATIGVTTPVLWAVPRTGGNTLVRILGQCQGMVLAGLSSNNSNSNTSKLQVEFRNGVKQIMGADLTTHLGRIRARNQGLRDVHPNVCMISFNLHDTADVFAGSFQADLWAWFRHPVERQISTYFYLRSLPPQHAMHVSTLSLRDWVWKKQGYYQANPMLASLLGRPLDATIGWTEADLAIAKNLLRDKAHIGLLERKTESLQRLLERLALREPTVDESVAARECRERLLDYAWTTKIHHATVGEKSDAYQLLLQSNHLDMRLYHYALYLFDLQKTN